MLKQYPREFPCLLTVKKTRLSWPKLCKTLPLACHWLWRAGEAEGDRLCGVGLWGPQSHLLDSWIFPSAVWEPLSQAPLQTSQMRVKEQQWLKQGNVVVSVFSPLVCSPHFLFTLSLISLSFSVCVLRYANLYKYIYT